MVPEFVIIPAVVSGNQFFGQSRTMFADAMGNGNKLAIGGGNVGFSAGNSYGSAPDLVADSARKRRINPRTASAPVIGPRTRIGTDRTTSDNVARLLRQIHFAQERLEASVCGKTV